MSAPDWSAYLRWRDAFGEVMDPRMYSLSWLDGEIHGGRMLMWADADAAILAQVRTYPTGARDIHGMVAAGDLKAIATRLIPLAEEWAKAAGCIGAVIDSREGWRRVLEPSGYRPYQIAVRKEL
jgi:hypothetical protein